MTRKALLALPFALLAPPAIESCRDPTEIKVTVSTDLDCPKIVSQRPHLAKTELFVLDERGVPGKVAETSACASGGVGDLVFVPGRADRVRVRVVGDVDWPGHAKPDPITSDRLIGFVPHTPLEIPIELSVSCIGVRCDEPDTTCARGRCVPIQASCVGSRCDVDAGPPSPADAAADADAGPNPIDGGAEAAAEAGACPPLLAMYNYRWPFDEGPMATKVVEQLSKVSSPLTGMLSPGGPCTGMIVLTGGKTQQLLGTTSWQLPKFGVSFWLYFIGGTGTVISRGATGQGGFGLVVDPQVTSFTVYGPNIASSQATTSTPPLSKWVRVYAAYTNAGVTVSIDGTAGAPGPVVPGFITSASDVILGGGTLSFAIADLQLGPP